MVHSQLSEQQIQFPPKGSPGLDPAEFPGLQRYAGQAVDNGPKAKAYADQFIKVHLKGIAGGQTYSAGEREPPRTRTTRARRPSADPLPRRYVRGLLLYAWGWSVVGEIALLGRDRRATRRARRTDRV